MEVKESFSTYSELLGQFLDPADDPTFGNAKDLILNDESDVLSFLS